MALVSLVVRDGVAQVYDGRHSTVFPGIVARVDGQEDWVAGVDVLKVGGLRYRVEDADAAAYWAVLAEGLLSLRAFGVNNVVVGMSEEEFQRIGREVGRFVKSQCGGKVAIRHGDHFALFALAPWSKGEVPDGAQRTVVLRVGAERVQAIRLVGGDVVEQFSFQPGWDEAVLWPAIARAYEAGQRVDLHEQAWEMFSSPSDDLAAFAETILQQVVSFGWTGQMVVSGFAGMALWKVWKQSWRVGDTLELAPAVGEAVGLWNFALLQGLGQ